MTEKRMSLEEARSVLWLRNNYRPLGELLDEGYLDERRLAWAAEKAYNPKLKEAAAVLLEWIRQNPATSRQPESPAAEPLPKIRAKLTLAQARATPWPFRPYKGRPMGELIDTRQVGLKDLGYAVENAWDERVRQAAIVLLAARLNQVVEEPPSPAGPLKVVSAGRSYSEHKQFVWISVQGMLIGAMGVLWLLLAIWAIRSLASSPSGPDIKRLASPAGITALLLLLAVGLGLGLLISRLFDWMMSKIEERIQNYRLGQEGEERVVEAMRQSLDGNWTLFRNITLPGRNKGDIDLVLVGPTGVWAVEVKTFTGEYRNIGERWEYRVGNRWKLLKSSPSRQAQNNAARLAGFFRADGIRQWVTPVVAWANPENPPSVENPMVAVWTLDRLPEELGNIWQGRTVEESVRARIIEKLTTLCRTETKGELD